MNDCRQMLLSQGIMVYYTCTVDDLQFKLDQLNEGTSVDVVCQD